MSITTIEWTKRPGTIGETWNPTTGCNKVDRGCKHCYAEIMHRRLQAMGQEKYKVGFTEGVQAHTSTLKIPLSWTKPRTVFVNSMSDLFHKDVPFEFIAEVFGIMQQTPEHTYLILTKRPERAVEFWIWRNANRANYLLSNRGTVGTAKWKCPPNVWMGTSVNDQKSADLRIPEILKLEDCLIFLSYEPATGPVDLRAIGTDECWSLDALTGVGTADGQTYPHEGRLDWVIMGGESGPKADPMDPAWVQKVRDDCKATGTPFFFKQWGLWQPYNIQPEPGKKYKVKHFLDGRLPMYKSNNKGFNELNGEQWQQFPALS